MAEDAGIRSNKKCLCLEAECSLEEYVQVDVTTLQLIFGMPYLLISWEGEDRARQLNTEGSLLQRNAIREENECLTLHKMKILSWLWR